MPIYNITAQVSAPDEKTALTSLQKRDRYVLDYYIRIQGHSSKACKCNVLYDGKLLNTSGGNNANGFLAGTTFRSLASAKRLINKLIVLYTGKYDPKLFIIVKI